MSAESGNALVEYCRKRRVHREGRREVSVDPSDDVEQALMAPVEFPVPNRLMMRNPVSQFAERVQSVEDLAACALGLSQMRESLRRKFRPKARPACTTLFIWPLAQAYPEAEPQDRDEPTRGHRSSSGLQRILGLLDGLTLPIGKQGGSSIEPARDDIETERGLIDDSSGDGEEVISDSNLKGVKGWLEGATKRQIPQVPGDAIDLVGVLG